MSLIFFCQRAYEISAPLFLFFLVSFTTISSSWEQNNVFFERGRQETMTCKQTPRVHMFITTSKNTCSSV